MTNFKHCGQCYRNIKGERWLQWTDQAGATLKEAKEFLSIEQKENPNDKFKIIKVAEYFYRIYKLVK